MQLLGDIAQKLLLNKCVDDLLIDLVACLRAHGRDALTILAVRVAGLSRKLIERCLTDLMSIDDANRPLGGARPSAAACAAASSGQRGQAYTDNQRKNTHPSDCRGSI